MATQTKRTNSRRKPKGSGRAGDGKGPGSQADLLQAMAKGLGNRELEQRLQRASGRRDDLLSLIADRLQKIRQVQIQESVLLQQKDKWWRDAAWREPGVWSPEPERWAAVAKEYRQAIEALCRGDLARGARLLERAMDTEHKAIEAVPHGLGLHPDEAGAQAEAALGPQATDGVDEGEGCPECERSADLKAAREIERFTHTARPLRGIKVELHTTPWWEEEEEEEEEEGEG